MAIVRYVFVLLSATVHVAFVCLLFVPGHALLLRRVLLLVVGTIAVGLQRAVLDLGRIVALDGAPVDPLEVAQVYSVLLIPQAQIADLRLHVLRDGQVAAYVDHVALVRRALHLKNLLALGRAGVVLPQEVVLDYEQILVLREFIDITQGLVARVIIAVRDSRDFTLLVREVGLRRRVFPAVVSNVAVFVAISVLLLWLEAITRQFFVTSFVSLLRDLLVRHDLGAFEANDLGLHWQCRQLSVTALNVLLKYATGEMHGSAVGVRACVYARFVIMPLLIMSPHTTRIRQFLPTARLATTTKQSQKNILGILSTGRI